MALRYGRGSLLCTTWISPIRPCQRGHYWTRKGAHGWKRIDKFTLECQSIRVARKLKAADVIDVLSELFILRGVPGHIRSDNEPESWPYPIRQ